MRYLFSVLFLALASCRYCGVDAPEDLRGAFADPERKIVIVITPEFLITAWEGRKASASDHKLSPLWGVKKYYHIVKDGNTLIIKAGPAWSDGGEALRVIGKDELETGNFLDRGGRFRRISLPEARKLLLKFGFDRHEIDEAPPFPLKHYYRSQRKKCVVYDSLTGKTQ